MYTELSPNSFIKMHSKKKLAKSLEGLQWSQGFPVTLVKKHCPISLPWAFKHLSDYTTNLIFNIKRKSQEDNVVGKLFSLNFRSYFSCLGQIWSKYSNYLIPRHSIPGPIWIPGNRWLIIKMKILCILFTLKYFICK